MTKLFLSLILNLKHVYQGSQWQVKPKFQRLSSILIKFSLSLCVSIYIYIYIPMRWSLRRYVGPTWEDVAPVVTVSTVGIKRTFKTHQVKWSRIYCDKLIWHHVCAIWTGGPVVVCGCWFDFQGRRSRYALLMRPNKVERAVQCSVYQMEMIAGFSSHGNSINICIHI